MTKVTFVGGENVGNLGFITWPSGPPGKQVEIVFPLNKAVEVTDKHILMKIRNMGPMSPFKIEGEGDDEEKATLGHGASAKHGDADEEDDEKGTLRGTRQRKIT